MTMTHVALCFTDSSGCYYKQALVTALSVLDNSSGPVHLHIVHDETLRPEAERAFTALCQSYGQRLSLYPVIDIPAQTLANVSTSFGKGTLYRVSLSRLVHEKKILYLDCDIICTCDIAQVYSYDIGEYFFGAVKMKEHQAIRNSKRYGLTLKNVFNCGVQLINLDKFRRELPDYAEQLFAIVRDSGKPMGDQAATNFFFQNRLGAILSLPEQYNFRLDNDDHSNLSLSEYADKILHFTGPKPWEVFSPAALLYWRYYAKAFPDEDVFGHMLSTTPHKYHHLYTFILRHKNLRQWVLRLEEMERTGFWGLLKSRMFTRKRQNEQRP